MSCALISAEARAQSIYSDIKHERDVKTAKNAKNQWLASFALFALFADKQPVYHLCSSAFICGLSFLLKSFDKNSSMPRYDDYDQDKL
jgi:hypothetical protein